LRLISSVVAACSSTAEAIVVWKSLISEMTSVICAIAEAAPVASA
jgi:hypothetical protein